MKFGYYSFFDDICLNGKVMNRLNEHEIYIFPVSKLYHI